MTLTTQTNINARAFLAENSTTQLSFRSGNSALAFEHREASASGLSIQISTEAREALAQNEQTIQDMKAFNQQLLNGPEPEPLNIADVIRDLERLLGLSPPDDDPKSGDNLVKALNNATNDAFGTFQENVLSAGFTYSEVSFSARLDQVEFSLETPNGSLDFAYTSFQFTFEARQVSGNFDLIQADPLILDLGGDGVTTTTPQNGLNFDLDADGRVDRIAGIGDNDAFLVLDRNQNGRIDNGKELFGEQHGAKNGVSELLKFDRNNDHIINALDPVFSDLKLMDREGRLSTLRDHGITQIRLDEVIYDQRERLGGTETARFTFDRDTGEKGKGAEILLNMLA